MERQLRKGYTTGTCAAAAAKAAARRLLGGSGEQVSRIPTRTGTVACLPAVLLEETEEKVRFGVRKDAGDDPDVTDGALICASVRRTGGEWEPSWYDDSAHPGIYIEGGRGVGRVTRPGLSCPVGKAAINPVPREMIWEAVEEVRRELGREEELLVTVEIPDGELLAEKTFNPKLGIEGGISVLGTTGIVEPMSEAALLATIQLEIHMKAVEGVPYLAVTPGNYGETFLREQMGISLEQGVKCSNFVKDTMVMLAEEGYRESLFAGHAGKLMKAAGGVENTHSRWGDRRMEILWDCARAVCPEELRESLKGEILGSNTTEEAMEYLERAGIRRRTGDEAAARLQRQILAWTGGRLRMDVILFTVGMGIFGCTEEGEGLRAFRLSQRGERP